MKKKVKFEFFLPGKYLKINFYHPTEDDGFLGAMKYLREQGKTCEFLGFNEWDNYVVVIDGIKYYGGIKDDPEGGGFGTFYVVDDLERDYDEKHYINRTHQILDALNNMV